MNDAARWRLFVPNISTIPLAVIRILLFSSCRAACNQYETKSAARELTGSDGAGCLKVWVWGVVHEKPDNTGGGGLSRAPFARVLRGSPVALPSPEKMNLGMEEMQFPAVLRGYNFRRFVLSNRRNNSPQTTLSPTPHLTISVQIWTNYETHILKKWGGTYPRTSVALPVSAVTWGWALLLLWHPNWTTKLLAQPPCFYFVFLSISKIQPKPHWQTSLHYGGNIPICIPHLPSVTRTDPFLYFWKLA